MWNGDYVQTGGTPSDARLKTDLLPVTDILERVDQLQLYDFEWNEKARLAGKVPGQRETGLIAQDVERVFPQFVGQSPTRDKKTGVEKSLLGSLSLCVCVCVCFFCSDRSVASACVCNFSRPRWNMSVCLFALCLRFFCWSFFAICDSIYRYIYQSVCSAGQYLYSVFVFVVNFYPCVS